MIATFGRMALVAAQWNKDPDTSAMLVWAPGIAWATAGLLQAWRVLRPCTARVSA